MCGIVAVITPDQSFQQSTLIAMRDRMLHRGPDGNGAWMDRTARSVIALGHLRLSIIDLSPAGAQPMFSADDRHVIIFNGEIYNYIELREELKALGHTFRSDSDTEVLIVSYAQWGVDCLKHLNGQFAFCLWDRQNQHMFVARDRFGEKPVYLARLPGGGMAIASEVKALFAHPQLKPGWRQEKVDHFLQGRTSYASTETFFEGIERLPPAQAMLIDINGNEVRRWRYWTPDYNNIRPIENFDETVEEFRELLIEAVKLRLRSDVRVGACLSGGLDSSTLVGIISKLEKSGTALFNHTYSARFDDDPTLSEGNYIDMMSRYCGLSAQSVSPRGEDMAAESERLHWHQEQPFLSASMYLEWCVTRKARETGTVVMLDGQGSDELLAGYHYYLKHYQHDLLLQGKWLELYKNTAAFNQRAHEEYSKYLDGERRIDPHAAFDVKGLVAAFGDNLAKTSIFHHGELPAGVPSPSPANRFRYKLAGGLLHDTMASNLHSADCNGMAHSIESRFPYLDYRLTDWAIRLPNDALIKDGWMKYILRVAGKGMVPDNIRWRFDKLGFAAPQDMWLRGGIKEWARERLFEGPVTQMPGYRRSQLEYTWNEHQSGRTDLSGKLWRYISMNEWLMLFENGVWQNGLAPQLTQRGRIAGFGT